MESDKLKRQIVPLFDELDNICTGAIATGGRGPVWDGTLVSKTDRDRLIKFGWIMNIQGWYFPTPLGNAIWKAVIKDDPDDSKSISDGMVMP